jgi:sulfide:quinone oxidoreductase
MMGLVNLWILNGDRTLQGSKVPLNNLENKGIKFLNDEVTKIDLVRNTVRTKMNKLGYDFLIVALGTQMAPDKIDGFTASKGFDLYNAEQIHDLRKSILSLDKGRISICISAIPYKCPPAPYEASLIINDMLVKNGTRDSIEINVYTPTPIALPVAGIEISQYVIDLLNYHHINFHPSHALKRVVGKDKIEFEGGKYSDHDLLIVIPPHEVPSVIKNSHLLDDGDQWIKVDKFTLATNYKNVFAIGDVTEIRVAETVTIPKAGIFAEGQAKAVSQQIMDDIAGNNKSTNFDGKGFCFMESGNKNAGYIDADFYHERGPITKFELPSGKSYEKKLDFEKSRMKDWLL